MSDTENTESEANESVTSADVAPEPAYGNPQPPYDFPVPEEYAETPFEELPEGLQRRVQMLAEASGPNIGGSDTAGGGGSVDPAIAPPDTAGTT